MESWAASGVKLAVQLKGVPVRNGRKKSQTRLMNVGKQEIGRYEMREKKNNFLVTDIPESYSSKAGRQRVTQQVDHIMGTCSSFVGAHLGLTLIILLTFKSVPILP